MKKIIASALVALAALGTLGASVAYANQSLQQVTICHQSANGAYEKLLTSPNAENGHFNPDGSAKQGHEGDTLLEGDQDCPANGGGGGGNGGGGGGNGGGGGGECVQPTAITNVVIDTGVLNDHKLTITWQGGVGATAIQINYSWDKDNLSQTVTVPNTGSYELAGLTNGINYWVQLIGLKDGCPTDPSAKIDPLP